MVFEDFTEVKKILCMNCDDYLIDVVFCYYNSAICGSFTLRPDYDSEATVSCYLFLPFIPCVTMLLSGRITKINKCLEMYLIPTSNIDDDHLFKML